MKGTWYAQVDPAYATYNITYNLNGGSVSGTQNPTSYSGTSDAITLNNPTRTGYTFAGWTGSNGNTPQTNVTISKGSTGNKTYTANWTANTYTVSIPKAVKYEGMSVGNVNIGTSYDITVKCKAGTFADTIEVSSTTSPMKAAGGSNDLSASSDSSKSPLVFTKEGTQQDHVVISGTTTTADKWTGSIQYAVSEK